MPTGLVIHPTVTVAQSTYFANISLFAKVFASGASLVFVEISLSHLYVSPMFIYVVFPRYHPPDFTR